MLAYLDTEGFDDCLRTLKGHSGIAGRFVALHLLLLQPKAGRQLFLRGANRNPHPNDGLGQRGQRLHLQARHVPGRKGFVLGQFLPQFVRLALIRLRLPR